MVLAANVLQKLYQPGSLLRDGADGICFSLENKLADARILRVNEMRVGSLVVSPTEMKLGFEGGSFVPGADITLKRPAMFRIGGVLRVRVSNVKLLDGKHKLALSFDSEPFGRIEFEVEDSLGERADKGEGIPGKRGGEADYSAEQVRARQAYAESKANIRLEHIKQLSFDPSVARGNIENLLGVAQVPIGLAGPLRVNGEHANGEFLIPLATTEGALVASYNRGMKILSLAGGANCTILADCMQRAPVFAFASARQARDFRDFVLENLETVRRIAESTSKRIRLLEIDPYLLNNLAFLRISYSTGDAAGQNMVSLATLEVYRWIIENAQGIQQHFLEANLATDKKPSLLNSLRTRGKRVVAEALIPRRVIEENLRAAPHALNDLVQIGLLGTFLAGANNNGLHSANALAAMFIATGQDVGNIAEGSAGFLRTTINNEGDLYISITLPALIVATRGGGTKLPTQRECLELLGCYGDGKANKLAEIMAAVVLAGEISLLGAIASNEWVQAHEIYGRNR